VFDRNLEYCSIEPSVKRIQTISKTDYRENITFLTKIIPEEELKSLLYVDSLYNDYDSVLAFHKHLQIFNCDTLEMMEPLPEEIPFKVLKLILVNVEVWNLPKNYIPSVESLILEQNIGDLYSPETFHIFMNKFFSGRLAF
jgi:hypothetical protein